MINSNMVVRDAKPEDYAVIEEIHNRTGFDFKFPDLSRPLYSTMQKVVEKDGKIIGAAVAKVEAEITIFLDPELTVKEKYKLMNVLEPEITKTTYETGYDSLVSYIVPDIAERFEKRLRKMGWEKARPWPVWVKMIQ